jgi:hypothetical protein
LIIPSRPRPLAETSIVLPGFIRAPIGLRNGARCYSLMDANVSPRSSCLELTTTAVPPGYWQHLWRVELMTEDSIGNAALLFSLLEDRGFEILTVESSVNWNPQYHSTNVVVSARQYSSDIDGSPTSRLAVNRQSLDELERDILAYLGDQVAIPPYKSLPLIKVRRLNSYKRLSDCLDTLTAFLISRNGIVLEGDSIRLSRRALSHMQNRLLEGDLCYTSSVDTKTKLVRTIIYNATKNPKFSVAVYFNSVSARAFSVILAAVSSCDLNVVQQQCRLATQAEDALMRREFDYDPSHYESSLKRLDLLLEREPGTYESRENPVVRLSRRIERINTFSGDRLFAHILPLDGGGEN